MSLFSTGADIAEARDKGAKALANGCQLRAKRTTGVDANEAPMQIEIFPSTPAAAFFREARRGQ